MHRYDVLSLIDTVLSDQLVICNLGIPSQELYAIGDKPNYFYMLGSMGMVSSIALGLALNTEKTVIALDGDGSLLMNPGSLVTVAHQNPPNLKWIVIDNGSHGSTGNQPTYTRSKTSLAEMARAAGITDIHELHTKDALEATLREKIKSRGLCFIVAKAKPGNRSVKPVPLDPVAIRNRFMEAEKAAN
ncbi:MAG: sulfopyruvate decarboxylase subunit beta [Deltaproteobacteria bacterium]|nr:sulfopyruvate decarboxylase subunit beta [Deltaproteobacteria bacterium]